MTTGRPDRSQAAPSLEAGTPPCPGPPRPATTCSLSPSLAEERFRPALGAKRRHRSGCTIGARPRPEQKRPRFEGRRGLPRRAGQQRAAWASPGPGGRGPRWGHPAEAGGRRPAPSAGPASPAAPCVSGASSSRRRTEGARAAGAGGSQEGPRADLEAQEPRAPTHPGPRFTWSGGDAGGSRAGGRADGRGAGPPSPGRKCEPGDRLTCGPSLPDLPARGGARGGAGRAPGTAGGRRGEGALGFVLSAGEVRWAREA